MAKGKAPSPPRASHGSRDENFEDPPSPWTAAARASDPAFDRPHPAPRSPVRRDGYEETKARWSAPPTPDTKHAAGGLAPSVVRGVEAEWRDRYENLRSMLERKTDELELTTHHLMVRNPIVNSDNSTTFHPGPLPHLPINSHLSTPFKPQTTKEESGAMLEKLAAVDGMVHGASRAPPPAARIQELVDRVVAAEKAAAKHQARAVRAEHERDDAERQLADASNARWETQEGQLVTELAAHKAEHSHRVEELQTRWRLRLDEDVAKARRDAEAERDAARAECHAMELQVAQMEFIRQERDALSSEKASLERAVAEMARLNSKLAARVAASAVGAIDAASLGLDFSALVPKVGAEADKKKGGKGTKSKGVHKSEKSGKRSVASSRDTSPARVQHVKHASEQVPARTRRGAALTTTASPLDGNADALRRHLETPGDIRRSHETYGKRGWNPGGIPPRPIPEPPVAPPPGLPPPASESVYRAHHMDDRDRDGGVTTRRELFKHRAKIPSVPARGSVGTSVSRAAGGYEYAPSRRFGKRVGEETPRHVKQARDAARRAAASLRHAVPTGGGRERGGGGGYFSDDGGSSDSRYTSAMDSPSGRVGMQLRDEFETLRVEYGELLDAAARGVNVSNLSDRLESVILKLERKSAIIARLQRS